MARAYSADMRECVIAPVESGASRREAVEHYEISASTAVIWVKCFRETGRCGASRAVGAPRRWSSTRSFCWLSSRMNRT
jgi:transposase